MFLRAFASLGVASLFVSTAFAQTKPKVQVPVENRAQAKAIVDQLLRQGKIIRSSQVRRGMRGVARSVFQGTKIEEFPVEVLGVLGRVQGGSDLVLIKVLGGPVVKRQSGIIAGMSGSPVYINGKMLGAIAIGWGFPKEPIGGVTPITDMIQSSLPDTTRAKPTANTTPSTVDAGNTAYVPREPLSLGGQNIARVEVSRGTAKPLRIASNGDAIATMRPVSTLLQVSGWSEKSLPRLRKLYEPYQIVPMVGPASKKSGVKGSLAPGGAIGVQLVSGDMDQTAVGTVTFRWGNRLLAFGHPMFGMGAVSLPITTSYIHDIFPSYQRSFKLSSPIEQMGALQQDTQYAIGGTIGSRPDMIPMTIALRDPERRIARTYRVRVMKDPALTPELLVNVAVEAVETALGQTSDKMVRVGLRMKVDGAEDIVRRNLIYSRDVITGAALNDFAQSLALTQQNEFARGGITRVDLDVALEPVRRTARIKSLFADRNRLKAGETVRISAVLEPTGEPNKTETKVFTFTVPEDAPSGSMRIIATPGNAYWAGQIRVGAAPPDPANLKELVSAWNKVGSVNVLTVQASTPDTYLLIDRKRIPNPSPSQQKLLRAGASSTAGSFNETQVRETATSYALSGAQALTLAVESRRAADKPATDAPAAATTEKPKASEEVKVLTADGTDADAEEPAIEIEDEASYLPSKSAFLGYLKSSDVQSNSTVLDNLQTTPGRAPIDRPITGNVPNPTPTPTPTATPTPTPTPVPTPIVVPADDGKGVARPALRWVQGAAADFLRGRFERAAVSSEGAIRPAPASSLLATTAEPFGWSVAGSADGTVYLGTGSNARILRIRNGATSTFYQGEGVSISALTTDAAGNLYAGVSPSGDVFRFAPDGKRTRILVGNSSAIWDFAWAADGALLAASGGEADNSSAIYRLTDAATRTEATGVALARLPQGHIRSIATRGTDIFAATANDGVLYRIDGAGKATALYQIAGTSSQPGEITSVVAAPEGVYFGTLNSGTIFRWNEKTGATAFYASPQTSVFALERGTDGTLYAATGDKGIVYSISPAANASDARGTRVLEPVQQQATALSLDKNGLLIATSNNAAVYRVGTSPDAAGVFTSAIFDAGNSVQWGALRATGDAQWETRSGNTAEPSSSWNAWQPVARNDLGELSITSSNARYLQLRGTLAQNAAISRIEVVYRAANSAPTVVWSAPAGGEFWKGKKTFTWSGTDPNEDALRYKMWISTDGTNWKPVVLKDNDAKSLELDTTTLADGTYRARIEASDAGRNPDDPQTDEAISAPFTIDNTAPVWNNVSVTKQDNGDWRIEATATDATSPLTGAEWHFTPPAKKTAAATKTEPKPVTTPTATVAKPADVKPAGLTPATTPAATATVAATPTVPTSTTAPTADNWNAFTARDGIFDSRRETLVAIIPASEIETARALGELKLEIRVRDAATNSAPQTPTMPR